MPRIAPAELKRIAAKLRRPMPPADMVAAADALNRLMGDMALVQDSPFRDAYVAGRFAAARRAETVWLGGDPPDFHIAGAFGCGTFEATETYPPGRRRSDEYRALAAARAKRDRLGAAALSPAEAALLAPTHDPPEAKHWRARTDSVVGLLGAAAAAKAAKGYPADWGLVMLLDLGGFASDDAEVVARMAPGTAAARHAFAEVWVLWHGVAYPCWVGGELASGGSR